MNAVENRRLLLGGVLLVWLNISGQSFDAIFTATAESQKLLSTEHQLHTRSQSQVPSSNPSKVRSQPFRWRKSLGATGGWIREPCGQNFDGVSRLAFPLASLPQNLRKLCLHLSMLFRSGERGFALQLALYLICLWNKIFPAAATQSQLRPRDLCIGIAAPPAFLSILCAVYEIAWHFYAHPVLRQSVGPTDMRGSLRLPVKSDELLDGLDLVRMVQYEADLVQYGYRMWVGKLNMSMTFGKSQLGRWKNNVRKKYNTNSS